MGSNLLNGNIGLLSLFDEDIIAITNLEPNTFDLMSRLNKIFCCRFE